MKISGETIQKKYFVYADVDLNTMLPFYYGSGNIDRILDVSRNKDHDKYVSRAGKKFTRFIVYQSDNRDECYDIEKVLIAINFDDKLKNKLTNKIVDSNNQNEVNNFLNKKKFDKRQPKLISEFKSKVCNNRKYFLITEFNSNDRFIATTINQILNFKQIKIKALDTNKKRIEYENLKGNKYIIEYGNKKTFHIQRVKGHYLINMFSDILQNIDKNSLESNIINKSRATQVINTISPDSNILTQLENNVLRTHI